MLRCPECEKARQLKQAQFKLEREEGLKNPVYDSPAGSGKWKCSACGCDNHAWDDCCLHCGTSQQRKIPEKEDRGRLIWMPFRR